MKPLTRTSIAGAVLRTLVIGGALCLPGGSLPAQGRDLQTPLVDIDLRASFDVPPPTPRPRRSSRRPTPSSPP